MEQTLADRGKLFNSEGAIGGGDIAVRNHAHVSGIDSVGEYTTSSEFGAELGRGDA
jgi:hypothetical protein